MKRQNELDAGAAEAKFKLACAWHGRGNLETAKSGYERVLDLNPQHVPASMKLAELMLKQGSTQEAVYYYGEALKLQPEDADLLFRYNYLKDLLNGQRTLSEAMNRLSDEDVFPDSPTGRINLSQQKWFRCHRSGWSYVIEALKPVHNSQGVRFDGFVEHNFAWKHWQPGKRSPQILRRMRKDGTFEQLATSEEQGITPYQEPWVGCIHNPQSMPEWFHFQESPQTIFAKDIWKKSLEHCKGLFTFSEYHADWLRQQTGMPVSTLVHPTEIPELQFDFEKFMSNPGKKIVQIGWWLRRLSSIYQLPIGRSNPMEYEKIRLVPMFFDNADSYLQRLIERELEVSGISLEPGFADNTREVIHLSNSEYDELLSANLVFLHLYDANANNAVIECIARATPLLVNPLPAVVEYLGENYPLYFTTLPEAAEKALDTSLVLQAHNYLKSCATRDKLTAEYFLQSFIESQIFQTL